MSPTETSTDNQLTLEHAGNHHQARVTLDPDTKRVNAGVITNFAEHTTVALQIADNKASGTLVHAGDTHALAFDVNKDGTFRGSYKDAAGLEIDFDGDEAILKSGEIPATGFTLTGDHHKFHIERDADDTISGTIESQHTGANQFSMKIEKGTLTGSFTHLGENHSTEVTLNQDGWKANISFDLSPVASAKGDAKFNFGIMNGKTGKRVEAGVRWKF